MRNHLIYIYCFILSLIIFSCIEQVKPLPHCNPSDSFDYVLTVSGTGSSASYWLSDSTYKCNLSPYGGRCQNIITIYFNKKNPGSGLYPIVAFDSLYTLSNHEATCGLRLTGCTVISCPSPAYGYCFDSYTYKSINKGSITMTRSGSSTVICFSPAYLLLDNSTTSWNISVYNNSNF